MKYIFGHTFRTTIGDHNHRWRGGVRMAQGRKSFQVGADHPMADKKGYALESRLVAYATLGRTIKAQEHVHHIDLDKNNNAPENLALVSRSQHTRLHNMVRSGISPVTALTAVGARRITDSTPQPAP